MGRRFGHRAAALAGLALLVVATAAQGAAEVRHRVSFPDLNRQYVHVTSEFPVSGQDVLLVMPSWAPGAYLIQDFAANVDHLAVRDGDGHALAVVKEGKDAWRVTLQGQQWIEVDYEVYAAQLHVSASYASPEFALLNGSSVFLYTDTSRDLPQRVQVDPDGAPGRVLTSLAAAPDGQGWLASDFDELVDNPIVLANAAVSRFASDGADYALVLVGDDRLWDLAKASADVQKVVAASNAFWGVVPFSRPYWFFNFLVEQGGGLEHNHGTVIMTSRWQMRNRQDYVKWLSVIAHEYFHAWNVRRMRPGPLGRYDYRHEQYTADLWLAEGFTSYYDDLLLSRARVVQPAEYLDRLALQIFTLELTPGRDLQSLESASNDAWIRHYQPNANSINSTVSYYTKGAVVGFVLDTRLRSDSDGKRSLDDVMRLMYREWGRQPYPKDALLDAVAEVGGRDVADWLKPMLSTTAHPDVDAALDWYGLSLVRDPADTERQDPQQPLQAGFGIIWSGDQAGLVVGTVVRGLSAAKAGVLPGDELLAIDGERVTRADIEDRKRRLRAGDTVEFLVSRNKRVLTIPVQLGAARPNHYEIRVREHFSKRRLRRLEDWLGQDLAMPH